MSEPNGQADTTNLAPLYLKMAAVMGHLERVPKRGKNEHFGYEYVTDSDVLDAVRKAMALEHLAFFVSVDDVVTEGKRTTVQLSITFADGDTGIAYAIHWPGEALDSQDKGITKAITSGVKYCLLKTFLMSTGDEDDPDGSKPLTEKPKRSKQARPTPQGDANQAIAELYGDYDPDLVEAQRETDDLEPTIDLSFVPDNMDDWELGHYWSHLRSLAFEHLGYSHDGHVKNTLKQIFGDEVPSYRGAWSELVKHQVAKQGGEEAQEAE